MRLVQLRRRDEEMEAGKRREAPLIPEVALHVGAMEVNIESYNIFFTPRQHMTGERHARTEQTTK